MPQYYLDTNILIEAKNRYYPFDLTPAFWDWIDAQAANGNIVSSMMVYNELSVGTDELALWAKDRKDSGLFLPPSPDAQQLVGEISTFVVGRYDQAPATLFLSGADPWVIAQAKEAGAKIVTMEKLETNSKKKIKIPNVAAEFDVPWCDTFTMMRELGARFS